MPAAPLTVARIDKTGGSGLWNRTYRFLLFWAGASGSLFDLCANIFWWLCLELITSTMKKGDTGTNGSDLNKSNIINPTLNHLWEEDCKALEAYHKEVDEIFCPLRDDTIGACPKGCQADQQPQVWGNIRGTVEPLAFSRWCLSHD
jgi:hypothetical protein